jgi:hypothetical protein
VGGEGDGRGGEPIVEELQAIDELAEQPVLGAHPGPSRGQQRRSGGRLGGVRLDGCGGSTKGFRAQLDAIDPEQPIEQAGSGVSFVGCGAFIVHAVTTLMGEVALMARSVA